MRGSFLNETCDMDKRTEERRSVTSVEERESHQNLPPHKYQSITARAVPETQFYGNNYSIWVINMALPTLGSKHTQTY